MNFPSPLFKFLPLDSTFSLSHILYFLPRINHLFSLLRSSIYSLRLVGCPWLASSLTRVGGVQFDYSWQGICSIGNSGNGIGTYFCLQKIAWQQYSLRQYRAAEGMGCSEQTHPRSSHNWLVWACLSYVWNEMGLLWGLGPVLILKNVRAKAQGPMGLGSYPIQ